MSPELSKRRTVLVLAIVAVFVVVLLVYRAQHFQTRLQVEPDAAKEIEKAKRR